MEQSSAPQPLSNGIEPKLLAVPPGTQTVADESPADDKRLSDYLWNLHKYVNDYVRFGDTKAAVILVFCTGLVGVLYNVKAPKRLLNVAPADWTFGDGLLVLSLILLSAAVFCIAMVIVPRTRSRQTRGFVYWNTILEHGTAETYWQKISERTDRELSEHLAHHVYDVASIVSRKYWWMNWAMRLALPGAGLGAMMALAG